MDSLQDFSRRIDARLATVRGLLTSDAADFEQSRNRFASQLQEFEALARRFKELKAAEVENEKLKATLGVAEPPAKKN